MSKISIRRASTEEELIIYKEMTNYAFAPSPTTEMDSERKQYFVDNKWFLLYEGETPVSSLDSIPMTENVRGKIYPMQGIAGVSTYPMGRYKGYINQLMLHSINDAREEGKVFSTLYPFKQSYYGKFGYITFPQSRIAMFDTDKLRGVERIQTKGEFERLEIKDTFSRYYAFLKVYQNKKHGFGLFEPTLASKVEKEKKWIVFVNRDNRDTGMMIYTTGGHMKDMKVSYFLYLDNDAKYVLLKYLALHIDQFYTISMRLMADERPENWLFDLDLEIKNREWVPSCMGRVIDVAGLAGMQVGDGELNINILDELCPWNSGIWRFKGDNGTLRVERAEKEECSLSIQGLSAIVYGGHDINDMAFRGWGELSEKSINTLQRLFPPLVPVLFELF
ncbi:MAG: GNAT family N-acetyltransferase [Candidatus Heimdallarchaeota archaeon]|nr:GNAT family N-acetyltransferase [Candidatus Heimdallarchaeota archaeon]